MREVFIMRATIDTNAMFEAALAGWVIEIDLDNDLIYAEIWK